MVWIFPMHVMRNVLATTLLLACSSLAAQEPIEWKFTAGETLDYEVAQRTSVDVDAGAAGSFSIEAVQVLDVVWKIEAVDDAGVASGVQQIERIKLNVTMPTGLELTYDSGEDEGAMGLSAMLAPMFDTLLENAVPIKVAPTGEVLECELPEAMAERLARVPATRAMSDLIVGSSVRQVAEQIALPVATGDEPSPRQVVIENRVLGTLRGELVWKPADSEESSIAKFVPQLKLTVEPVAPTDDDEPLQPRPLKSPKIAEQSVNGSAEFDTAAGRLKSSNWSLDLELIGQLMGNDVTSNMTQTVDVTSR